MAARPTPTTMTDFALVAVFTGMTAALTLAPAIPVGAIGVPITLQTLAVALTGMILGGRRAFAALALYVVLGLAGLPILAGGGGGLGAVVRPSFGYLISFPFTALVIGLLAGRVLARGQRSTTRTVAWLFVAGLLGRLLVTTPLGWAGLMINGRLSLPAAVLADLPFWPGDIAKALVAAVVAAAVHRAFPTLLGAPRTAGVPPQEHAATR